MNSNKLKEIHRNGKAEIAIALKVSNKATIEEVEDDVVSEEKTALLNLDIVNNRLINSPEDEELLELKDSLEKRLNLMKFLKNRDKKDMNKVKNDAGQSSNPRRTEFEAAKPKANPTDFPGKPAFKNPILTIEDGEAFFRSKSISATMNDLAKKIENDEAENLKKNKRS